jgi:hypothetical protein
MLGRPTVQRVAAPAARPVIQRAPIDLTRPTAKEASKKSFWSSFSWSSADEKFIKDYQKIQQILTNEVLFKPALRQLEGDVNELLTLDSERLPDRSNLGSLTTYRPYAQYLELVLLRNEQKFGVNVALPEVGKLRAAPVYTKTLSGPVFSELSNYALLAQDPGAYASHGEFSHRIQWYIIFFYAETFENKPRDLVMNMTNHRYNPIKEAWPTDDVLPPGISGTGPAVEGSGSLWDALLDRQINPGRYRWDTEGLTTPEMLTAFLTGDRADTDVVQGHAWAAANLPTLATIIEARKSQVETEGDTPAEHERRAGARGYSQYREGVWVK